MPFSIKVGSDIISVISLSNVWVLVQAVICKMWNGMQLNIFGYRAERAITV